MDTVKTLPEIPDEDSSPIRWAPWLTHRRLMLFVIGWLVLFALLSVFVSNPFQSETSASATRDYAKIMFLHGLLVGMVGLLALLACQVLGCARRVYASGSRVALWWLPTWLRWAASGTARSRVGSTHVDAGCWFLCPG